MKLKLNILLPIAFVAMIAGGFTSCSDDEFTDSIFDTREFPLDRSAYTFPLDTFCKKNFLEPYNLRFLYKMEDIGSNMNYNLVPCTYDQSKNLAVLAKYLWYDVYKEHVGDLFLKKYSPRIIHVIGSPAYNPSSGTMILGVAEGGKKITLHNANDLDPNNIEGMNELFFKTMHHEFSHILNQNVNRPTSYDLLSNGKYNAISWQDTPDSVALGQGFVSPYASSGPGEDWVEDIANYIVKDTITWQNMLSTASFAWELVTDVDAEYWNKIDRDVRAGLANRDSVGYFVRTSSTSGGEDATYAIQRKVIQRDSDNKYAVPDEDGNIVFINTSGVMGRDLILQKLDMVRTWLKDNFNYDLESVRQAVLRRQYLTDEDGNFVLDSNGRFINNLTYRKSPEDKTVMEQLIDELNAYESLQIKK